MQLCTPPAVTATGGSPVSSGAQEDLPGTLPTPARDNGHLTAQVQGNWDAFYDLMEKQETAASVLTGELKMTSSQHESPIEKSC